MDRIPKFLIPSPHGLTSRIPSLLDKIKVEAMTTTPQTALTAMLGKAAKDAGLLVIATESGLDFNQKPTTRFRLGLPDDSGRTLLLCGAREQPAELLAASEFVEHIGRENILPHVQAALARAREITEAFSGVGPIMAAELSRVSL